MFTRLVVLVTDDELCALQTMSEAEMRSVREQLRFLLREEGVDAACLNLNHTGWPLRAHQRARRPAYERC